MATHEEMVRALGEGLWRALDGYLSTVPDDVEITPEVQELRELDKMNPMPSWDDLPEGSQNAFINLVFETGVMEALITVQATISGHMMGIAAKSN